MNFLGHTYNEARHLFAKEAIYPYKIRITSPPDKRIGKGKLRVIGEIWREEKLELILAYEDYEKKRGAKGKSASQVRDFNDR